MMTVTPLQIANVMSIIANKGYYYTPHLVNSIEGAKKQRFIVSSIQGDAQSAGAYRGYLI